jgi:hypothetical protein
MERALHMTALCLFLQPFRRGEGASTVERDPGFYVRLQAIDLLQERVNERYRGAFALPNALGHFIGRELM